MSKYVFPIIIKIFQVIAVSLLVYIISNFVLVNLKQGIIGNQEIFLSLVISGLLLYCIHLDFVKYKKQKEVS